MDVPAPQAHHALPTSIQLGDNKSRNPEISENVCSFPSFVIETLVSNLPWKTTPFHLEGADLTAWKVWSNHT